ncbi:MAG: hypothetical protein JWR50_4228 [Mucilaginibacter sp.]|nr:hypothetical protein [Mucilaginibacter sp.]
MRLLKLITLLILFISPTLLKAQAIEWQQDRPLTWNDFNGRPDYQSRYGAVSYWNIVYNYSPEYRDCSYIINFKIRNLFDKNASWERRDGESDYLLGHEQLHFDISEIFTRKLAAAFQSAVFTSNYKAEIDEIYSKIWAECGAMQVKYDSEAEHGSNKNMQLRWQLFVFLQLKALPRNY